MATKHTKYGKAYNTPTGLQEDNYYEMMYDLMDYVNKKGLTTRQAQSLFTDCSDMVLDVAINLKEDISDDNKSDIDKLLSELNQIRQSLDYLPDRLFVGDMLLKS